MLSTPPKKSRAPKKSTPRKRKWDEKYINYGFFTPKNSSSLPGKQLAQCMFCAVTYSNQGWVPSKLQSHLEITQKLNLELKKLLKKLNHNQVAVPKHNH